MHKILVRVVIGCVLLGAALTLIQIWTEFLDWEQFIKVGSTLAIITVVCGFIVAAKSDLSEHKKLRDENYLD